MFLNCTMAAHSKGLGPRESHRLITQQSTFLCLENYSNMLNYIQWYCLQKARNKEDNRENINVILDCVNSSRSSNKLTTKELLEHKVYQYFIHRLEIDVKPTSIFSFFFMVLTTTGYWFFLHKLSLYQVMSGDTFLSKYLNFHSFYFYFEAKKMMRNCGS